MLGGLGFIYGWAPSFATCFSPENHPGFSSFPSAAKVLFGPQLLVVLPLAVSRLVQKAMPGAKVGEEAVQSDGPPISGSGHGLLGKLMTEKVLPT